MHIEQNILRRTRREECVSEETVAKKQLRLSKYRAGAE